MKRRFPIALVLCLLALAVAIGAMVASVAIDDAPPGAVGADLLFPASEPQPVRADLLVETTPDLRETSNEQNEATRAAIESAGLGPAIPAAELADALWVEGRVVFPAGTPADERIEIVAQGRLFSSRKFHSTTVASDGSFRVAFEKKTKHASLELRGRYGYLVESRKIDPSTETKDIVLEPKLGAYLRGRVQPSRALLGEEARFVGTKVHLLTEWSEGFAIIQRKGELDARLEFEIGALPADRVLELTASPPKAARIHRSLASITAGTTRTIELALLPGLTLRGKVIDEAGAGIEEAELQVVRRSQHSSFRFLQDMRHDGGTSASDGSFEITGVPAGDWVVHARKTGFVAARTEPGELADGAVREGLTLVLTQGGMIRGRVEFADGKPAIGANVSWRSLTPPDRTEAVVFGYEASTKAENDGTFTISGLEEGPFRVVAQARQSKESTASATTNVSSAEGDAQPAAGRKKPRRSRGVRVQAVAEKVEPGTNGLFLVLSEGSKLAGRVVDGAGKPFETFEVSARRIDRERPFLMGATDGEASERVTDPDGRFVLEGLREGEWDVSADAHGAAKSLPRRIRVPHAGDPLEILLVRAASIAGTVVDPAGQPVAGARLHLAAGQFQPHGASDQRKPDAVGHFALDDVVPGPVGLSAFAPGWADSEPLALDLAPEQTVVGITLALRRGGRVTGEVLDDAGRPDGGRRLTISSGRSDMRRLPGVQCDATGRFEIVALAPGSYAITTDPNAEEMSDLTAGVGGGGWMGMSARMKTARVVVVDDASVHVVLGAPSKAPVRVHGTIRSDGEIVAGVQLCAFRGHTEVTNPTPRRARSDARGRYELVLDEPGAYEIGLSRSERGAWTYRRETIPPGDRHELDFDLPVSRITGHVIGPDGAPIAGVNVVLQSDRAGEARSSTSSSGGLQTETDGAFAFADLVPGSYRLQAGQIGTSAFPGMSTGHAIVVREGLVIGEDTRLEGLVLELAAGCVVEGVVLGPLGAPAVAASVFARDENGVSLLQWMTCTTDSAGRFRLEGLPTGRTTFFARTQTLASEESAPVTLSPGESSAVEIRLRSATRLYVVVEEADGKQVGAQTRVFDEHGRDCAGFWVRPPPGGAITPDEMPGAFVATLPPGRYRVVATNHDGASASATMELRGEPQTSVTVRYGS